MFEFLQNNKIFIGLLSACSLLRVMIGITIPVWLITIGSGNDDFLFLDYSHLVNHFTNWNIQSLVKDISYPIFLFFVRISKVSYRFWISILWVIAAILVVYAIYKFLTKDNRVLFLSFLFILFQPVAFDVGFGLRVYRNAIQSPCAIIFLASLYIFINYLYDFSRNKLKTVVFWAVVLGFIFSFNYYIKEDGILTLPIFLICIVAVLLFIIYDRYWESFTKANIKNIIKISIIAILPIIIFAGCTVGYQEVNYHYFGVHEINTRTGGELGEFYSNLLKIDDNNKTTEIWIPASTVEKAYNASPTLQMHQEFIDNWMHKTLGGGVLINSTIAGDYPAWSLRYALLDSGVYTDEKSVNDLFYLVNQDLNHAFNNGSLNESKKIFITHSANGKSLDEIFELSPLIAHGIELTLFYDGFNYDYGDYSNTSSVYASMDNKKIEADLNDHLFTQEEMENPSFLDKMAYNLTTVDGIIYHFSSYIIVLLVLISLILLFNNAIKERFKNRKFVILILFLCMLFATLIVQIFAVSWFCAWLSSFELRSYLVSSYGVYATLVVFAIAGAYSLKSQS